MNSKQFHTLDELLEDEYQKGYSEGQRVLRDCTFPTAVLREIRDKIFALPTNQMATSIPNCDGDSTFVVGISRADVMNIINNAMAKESAE